MSSRSNIISTVHDLSRYTGETLCFIGIGANLESSHGSPVATVLSALEVLAGLSDLPVVVSSLWQTTPLDCPPDSPVFVNAVLAMVPRKPSSPLEFLVELQGIEQEFGRVRTGIQNAPRALDLDLLAYGSVMLSTDVLTLPHPRLASRRFVLAPLAEIAPGYVPPGQSVSVEVLLALVEGQGELQRINIPDTL